LKGLEKIDKLVNPEHVSVQPRWSW